MFAMLMLVLVALFGAGVTHAGGQLTYRAYELAVAGHESYRRVADVGAVAIQPDALRHFFYIILPQASVEALTTRYGTFLTCLHT